MDYNIAWGKATVYLKEHIEPHDTIVIAPVCQLCSFLYYFRENEKGILKDIDTYGKIKDGLLLQCFKERNYNIVGINQTQGRTKEFFLKDTQAKLKLAQHGNGQNIWVLIDRWIQEPEKKLLISSLSFRNKLSFRKKFRGLELYKFNLRQKL